MTATRTERLLSETPGHVSVLDREQVQAKGGIDVSAALDGVDGVRVLSHGGSGASSSVHIRGTYGVHTLVLVDGRTQNTPSQGSADLSGISPAFVERIEVVRGPSSALYGTGAVGGLVQVLTLDVPGEPTREFDTFFGTFDTLGATFLAGAPFGPGGGSVFGVHGFRTGGDRPNSEAESVELFGKLRLGEAESGGVVISLGFRDSTAGWPGARPDPAAVPALGNAEASSLLDFGDSRRGSLQAEFLRGGFRVRASLDRIDDDAHQEWLDFASEHIVQDRSLDTTKPSLDIDTSWTLNDGLRILTGASVEHDRFRVATTETNITVPDTTLSGRIDERTTAAAWAQAEFENGPWQGVAGLRWDEPSDYDGEASGRLLGAWKNDASLRIEAGLGTAFRAPSLNDLNWPADFWSAGNPDLEPETSFEADVTVKWQAPGERGPKATFSVFSKSVEDMIVWMPDNTDFWQPENLNDVEIRGLELALAAPVSKGCAVDICYSLLDSKEEGLRPIFVDYVAPSYAYDTIRRDTPYTPEHQIGISLSWSRRVHFGECTAALSASWRSDVVQYYRTWPAFPAGDITYPEKTLPGCWLIGLRTSLSRGKREVFVRADNLLDEDHALQFGPSLDDHDYPMPGRSVTVGARIRF
ncbi:MAG: TonB-dependent receptor plug domain-containing protein [Planctomycetota bacterium]